MSYLLYSLYAPHSIFINPFKSVLFNTFVSEREQAVSAANGGGTSENEQLVWVLWKILKGDGNDVGFALLYCELPNLSVDRPLLSEHSGSRAIAT